MSKPIRKSENKVYIVLWIIVWGLFLLDNMRSRALSSMPLFDTGLIIKATKTLLPYFILFFINNYFLIPRLLLHNRMSKYLIAAAVCVGVLWLYQYIGFVQNDMHPQLHEGLFMPPPPPRSIMPMPLALDFTYALLVMGCNIAIALGFQRFYDRLEHERLQKSNAESALAYLKAQISPHFYMNMLNNIHGMIEINPEKAQTMVLDMSRLMRYMLYESSKPLIRFSDEIDFIENYIRLMRLRYDGNKVSITTKIPADCFTENIKLPPLLFLVFIENAFKHGISYHEKSFVAIEFEVLDKHIRFVCSNSVTHSVKSSDTKEGIGLKNVIQRLDLLYGDKAILKMDSSNNVYVVTLNIPYETQDTDNRR